MCLSLISSSGLKFFILVYFKKKTAYFFFQTTYLGAFTEYTHILYVWTSIKVVNL